MRWIIVLLTLVASHAASSPDADSLHRKPTGTKVTNQFWLGQKLFYLPAGEWTLIATDESPLLETRFRSEIGRFGAVLLADVQGKRLARAMWAQTNLGPSSAVSWSPGTDPCKPRTDVHLDKQMGRSRGDQYCLRVNHVPSFLSGSRGWFQRAERWLLDNEVSLGTTYLSVEFAKLHERALAYVYYYFNPEMNGFAPSRRVQRGLNDWHRDYVKQDSSRMRYVNEIISWGEKIAPDVLQGVLGNPRSLTDAWGTPFPRTSQSDSGTNEVLGPDGRKILLHPDGKWERK